MLLTTLVLTARPAAADDVAAFLERHDLKALLAVHLEEQLGAATADQRDGLIFQLANLYAELLEGVTDEEDRIRLEQRGRRLLATAPPRSAQALRLALLRGSFRTVERTAEQHRLRLTAAAEVDRAKEILDDLIPKLNQLRQAIEKHRDHTDHRASRAGSNELTFLTREAARVRDLYQQSVFLTAWALYYQSWLNDRRDNARVAEQLFAELLDPEEKFPEPEDVSVDLRGVEAFARSILGMALCKSLTSATPTVMAWLELLDHEEVEESVKAEIDGWKLAIYLERGAFTAARDHIERQLTLQEGVPVVWLRLAAVYALEDQSSSRDSTALLHWAVGELAAREELQQIYDLASRYGVDALGTPGFTLQYVRGLLAYRAAREAHGGDRPVVQRQHLALYGAAFAALNDALRQPDAESNSDASAVCRRLIGWCHYYRSEFLAARQAFESAAELLGPEEAADALWMAIVCIDRILSARDNIELERQRLALIERFLEQYPASVHAPRLVLMRATSAPEASEDLVTQLLAIPRNSEVHDRARRQAAQMLYELYRNTATEQRAEYAHEFLAVVTPLLELDETRLDEAIYNDVQRYIIRNRQVLEIALSDDVERIIAAREALARLDRLAEEQGVDLESVTAELTYRRIQERLYDEDLAEADRLADELWDADPAAVWARLSIRAVFKVAHQRWRDAAEDDVDDRRWLAIVVKEGERVLREFEGRPDSDGNLIAYRAAVADAAFRVWQRTQTRDQGERARSLYEKLLEVRPSNAKFLRAVAELAKGFGDRERALECWRILLAGAEVGSSDWYEAKFNLITLLADVDEQRARAVMDQHKRLYPEYGPNPWGARLKALDLRLAPAEVGAPETRS